MIDLLIRRELRNTLRDPQTIFQPLLFFALTICLFPIVLGIEGDSLAKSAPAAVWIALLFACLLAAGNLFEQDYANGILTQDVLHLPDLWLLIIAKILAAWTCFVMPLLIMLPLMGALLNITPARLPGIAAQTALGSLSLLAIATLGAVLTLNRKRTVFLQFLITVPLYLPTLIIGSNATHNLLIGLPVAGEYALLGAIALFSGLSIVPFSTLALRNQALP